MDAAPDALPYHWLELGEMLLEAASDDFEEPDLVRKLLRGLREVRMAKLRSGVDVLDAGGGFKMNGIGGMEVGEGRSFITGVIDGLRHVYLHLGRCQFWRFFCCCFFLVGANTEQKDCGFTRTAAQGPGPRRAGERIFGHGRLRRRRNGHAMNARLDQLAQ